MHVHVQFDGGRSDVGLEKAGGRLPADVLALECVPEDALGFKKGSAYDPRRDIKPPSKNNRAVPYYQAVSKEPNLLGAQMHVPITKPPVFLCERQIFPFLQRGPT